MEKLARALRESSANDVIAANLGLGNSHADGWGYVISSENGISFHKTHKALAQDQIVLPEIRGKAFAYFHARKATNKTTVSDRFSHPFFGDTKESHVFFSHNGSVNEARLRSELGYEGTTIDSELAFKYTLRHGIEEGSKALESYVNPNSALNLMILELPRNDNPKLYVKHFYKKTDAGVDKTEYYNLYFQKMKGGCAIFSSTLNHYGLQGAILESTNGSPFKILS